MTKRILTATVCVCLAAAAPSAVAADNAQALRKLDETIQAAFDDVPLKTAVEYLSVRSGLKIDVNWRLLGKLKIAKDTPVIFELSKHSVRTCFDVLCAVIGGDKMTWTLEDGTVKISTTANLVHWRTMRTHSIRAAAMACNVTNADLAERLAQLIRATQNVSFRQQGSRITVGATLAGHRKVERLLKLCEKGPAAGSRSDLTRLRVRLAVKTLPEVNFVDTPLKLVVTFLQNMTGQGVVVDWPALKAAGITAKSTVSLNLKNVSALKVLDRIVEELDPTEKKIETTVIADAGVMMITTPAVATTQVYSVAFDLLPVSRRDGTAATAKTAKSIADQIKSLMGTKAWAGGRKVLVPVGRTRLICINTVKNIRAVSDRIDMLWGQKTR